MVDVNEIRQNAGRGIGPVLEARDVLQVLEQKSNRPLALEAKALRLAGKLLDLCYSESKNFTGTSGEDVAREILMSGKARKKWKKLYKRKAVILT